MTLEHHLITMILLRLSVIDRSYLTVKHLLPIRLVFNVLAPVSHITQLLVLKIKKKIFLVYKVALKNKNLGRKNCVNPNISK